MKSKYYLLTVAILALDHATKWLVQSRLSLTDTIELIDGYLRFSHVRNPGVAFGLFASSTSVWKPYVLAAMAIAAVVSIFVYSARMPSDRRLLQCGLASTMGGILGNFIDRITRGFVIDFIEFHVHETFYWPTFNVADSAITIGIGLLILDALRNADPVETAPTSP